MELVLNKRRGFLNGATAAIHEDIVMNDRLFNEAQEEAMTADPESAGTVISRIYSMRTGKTPQGVDWKGIAKSLANAL